VSACQLAAHFRYQVGRYGMQANRADSFRPEFELTSVFVRVLFTIPFDGVCQSVAPGG
jgi:hypothetical protein